MSYSPVEKQFFGLNTDQIESKYLLHEKVVDSFLSLKNEALKNNFELVLISSHRSFEKQLTIWNEKINGKRVLLDSFENPINPNELSPIELLKSLLYFSAIPGFSRHHWGTDIDIIGYDCSLKNTPPKIELTDKETLNWPFKEFHLWLSEFLLSKENPGFKRPYLKKSEYMGTEKWHLSHIEISKNYEQIFSESLYTRFINEKNISLKDQLLELSNMIIPHIILRGY